MAELADARDLKSREINFSYRFDPGFRHHYIAEWSSLVARRAHNPKVMRFKSHLRNQKTKPTLVVGFIFCSRRGLPPLALRFWERRAWLVGWRAKNSWELFLPTEVHKARSSRRALRPTMSDYATGQGNEKSHLRNPCACIRILKSQFLGKNK